MQIFKEQSRAERALLIAQRCTAEIVFSEVTNRLRREPCVAFAFACDDLVDWSPETDIAVRMLSIVTYGRPVDHGRLIWGLERTDVTAAAVDLGLKAVTECMSILKEFHQPFEFLAHVEGQTSITVSYRGHDENAPLSRLADALANEVGSLCG